MIFRNWSVFTLLSILLLGGFVPTTRLMNPKSQHIAVFDPNGKPIKKAQVRIIHEDGSFSEGHYDKKAKAYAFDEAIGGGRSGISVQADGFHPAGMMLSSEDSEIRFDLIPDNEPKILSWPQKKWWYADAPRYVHLEFRPGGSPQEVQQLLLKLGLELSHQGQVYQKTDGSDFLRYFDPILRELNKTEIIEYAAPCLQVFKEWIDTGTKDGKVINRGEEGALFPFGHGIRIDLHNEALEDHDWIDQKQALWGLEFAKGYEYLKKRKKTFVKQENKQPNIVLVQEPDSVRDYRSPLLLVYRGDGTGLGMLDLMDKLNDDKQVKNSWFLTDKSL